MYKIGDTSGLCDKSCDEQKHTIKVVGDIVEKLSKKCCDVPKKMRAPSKVIEVTDGCFSSAQVINVCDEYSNEDGGADGADGACSGAASAGGGCGGGRSSKSCNKDASQSSCNKGGGGCGGKSSQASKCNKNTGDKLVDMKMPDYQEVVRSGISAVVEEQQEEALSYRQAFCALKPYPECATCPYATQTMQPTEVNIQSMYEQMEAAMRNLNNGDYEMADEMLGCPGQMAALMNSDLGPIANTATPKAVSALISLVAVRGVVNAFENLATAAEATDFRREIMWNVDNLLRAGSEVGLPNVFAEEVGRILSKIGCSPKTLTHIRARSHSARETSFGDGYNLWGSRGSGTCRTEQPYRSSQRPIASPGNARKAEKALETIAPSLEAAEKIQEDPVKAVEISPTTKTPEYVTVETLVPQPGETYYKQNPADPTDYIELDEDEIQDLENAAAKYGEIYVVKDTGVTPDVPATVTEDKVVDQHKYYYKDPVTERFIPIEVTVNEPIANVKQRISDITNVPQENVEVFNRPSEVPAVVTKLPQYTPVTVEPGTTIVTGKYVKDDTGSIVPAPSGTAQEGKEYFEKEEITLPTESAVTYKKTEDTEPDPKKEYCVVDETGMFVHVDIRDILDTDLKNVYERVVRGSDSPDYAKVYTGSEPLVLDSGIVVSKPTFLDAGSMDMAIDTTSLITRTNVTAGEMANIEGIGMTDYEVKMAYILDNERNGSILPFDIHAQRLSTVLETVNEWDV